MEADMTRRMIHLALALTLSAAPALAQDAALPRQTVQDVLSFIVTNKGVVTDDFDRDREAAEATRLTLTRTLLSAVAAQPIGTSSSGFTYRLNRSLGTVER